MPPSQRDSGFVVAIFPNRQAAFPRNIGLPYRRA